ncbi:MAG: hypothetical protein AAF211_33070, partial [Myxococcota bacterium]
MSIIAWWLGCGPANVPSEPTNEVVSVASLPGPRTNQFAIEALLAAPGPVAVLCTAEHDETERILVESTELVTRHTLRISGLRPDSRYTCAAFPAEGEVARSLAVAIEAGASPVPFTPLEVTVDPDLGMTREWTLLVRPGVDADHAWLVIYDAEGLARWWHPLPRYYQSVEALFHPEDDTMVWGGGDREIQDGRPGVIGLWDGETRIDVPGYADVTFHHDGVRLDDGRFLTLEGVPNTADDLEF